MKAVKAAVVAAEAQEAVVEALVAVAVVPVAAVVLVAAAVLAEEALAVAVLVVKEAQAAVDLVVQAAVQGAAPAGKETKERALKCAKMKSTTKKSNMRICLKPLEALMT